MTALKLFKKAGLADYIQPTLIGGGIGASALGLASLLQNKEDEPEEVKKKRLYSNLLTGLGLGGALGAGYHGFSELTSGSPASGEGSGGVPPIVSGEGSAAVSKPGDPDFVGSPTPPADRTLWQKDPISATGGLIGAGGGAGSAIRDISRENALIESALWPKDSTLRSDPLDVLNKMVKPRGLGPDAELKLLQEAGRNNPAVANQIFNNMTPEGQMLTDALVGDKANVSRWLTGGRNAVRVLRRGIGGLVGGSIAGGTLDLLVGRTPGNGPAVPPPIFTPSGGGMYPLGH